MTPWGYRATAFVLFRPLSAALRGGVVNALIFNLIYIFIPLSSFLPLISLIISLTEYLFFHADTADLRRGYIAIARM